MPSNNKTIWFKALNRKDFKKSMILQEIMCRQQKPKAYIPLSTKLLAGVLTYNPEALHCVHYVNRIYLPIFECNFFVLFIPLISKA